MTRTIIIYYIIIGIATDIFFSIRRGRYDFKWSYIIVLYVGIIDNNNNNNQKNLKLIQQFS